SDHKRLVAADVHYTVEQLRQGKATGLAPAWGDLLDDVPYVESAVAPVTLRQGWMEPLALMQFKVLPSHANPEPEDFARHPGRRGEQAAGRPAPEGPRRQPARLVPGRQPPQPGVAERVAAAGPGLRHRPRGDPRQAVPRRGRARRPAAPRPQRPLPRRLVAVL